MAQAPVPLPPAFADLERRLDSLLKQQAQGRITPESFQKEVQNLTLHDATGRAWWLGGAPGAWHWWNGRSWVPGHPPLDSPSQPPLRQTSPLSPRRRKQMLAGIGILVFAAACLLVVGAILLGAYNEYQALPKIAEQLLAPSRSPAPHALSAGQQSVRDEMGPPEAFTLQFYEIELEDGSSGDVRQETWSYYTQGIEYTYIDGEQVERYPIEVEFGRLIPVPYFPEQFTAYMRLDEVVAAAGLDAYAVVPLDAELLPGSELYFADQLAFGLKAGELLYLEALVLDVEE